MRSCPRPTKAVAAVLAAIALGVLAGCAAPMNPRLDHFDPRAGYRFANLDAPDNSDDLFVILTFSGGGTRAAALAYGVMQKLADTPIQIFGQQRRLLDEVDVISAVSGGSFTAAYFGLFGDELFTRFQKDFLRANVQDGLVLNAMAPWGALRLLGPYYSRSDLAGDYYDRSIFRGRTFADLAARKRRPYIIINSTDMTIGAPFHFTQDQFDLLYSDLGPMSVGRAVAASSAVPVLLAPMTMRNYPAGDDFREPTWITRALDSDRPGSNARYRKAEQWQSYRDKERRPYIHLMDGALSDNLGVRPVLHALTTDSSWSLQSMVNLDRVRCIVVIVVNAGTQGLSELDRSRATPDVVNVARATGGALLTNTVLDSITLLRERIGSLQQAAHAPMPTSAPDSTVSGRNFLVIEVGFDGVRDPKRRADFWSIPTSFKLKDAQVDELIAVGGELLNADEGFQALVEALTPPPTTQPQGN
ncbi:MAG: hypothetical protein BIFFINMI_02498 [Phycisphaerae bacterium]|nr:hypothetical protein [Phycisphaerae bacterium]